MTMWMLTNVIVYAGVMKIVKVKTFPQQRKEENLLCNMLKAIIFRVILLIMAIRSLGGVTPILNQIA
jgi:hypothetical protein